MTRQRAAMIAASACSSKASSVISPQTSRGDSLHQGSPVQEVSTSLMSMMCLSLSHCFFLSFVFEMYLYNTLLVVYERFGGLLLFQSREFRQNHFEVLTVCTVLLAYLPADYMYMCMCVSVISNTID